LTRNQVQRQSHQLQKIFQSKNKIKIFSKQTKIYLFRPLFDSKTLNSGENSVQSSPPEARAIPPSTSQRVNTAVSRTDSYDSTTSAIGMKTGRLHKVNQSHRFLTIPLYLID
jgi:hypothetical protein